MVSSKGVLSKIQESGMVFIELLENVQIVAVVHYWDERCIVRYSRVEHRISLLIDGSIHILKRACYHPLHLR